MSRARKTKRERMSEWVLHCAVNQRHIRRSQPTREAALRDANELFCAPAVLFFQIEQWCNGCNDTMLQAEI